MTISITEFKSRCLELIKDLRPGAAPIQITRHGRVVASVVPPVANARKHTPWERLHGSGTLLASPSESVLQSSDFEAGR